MFSKCSLIFFLILICPIWLKAFSQDSSKVVIQWNVFNPQIGHGIHWIDAGEDNRIFVGGLKDNRPPKYLEIFSFSEDGTIVNLDSAIYDDFLYGMAKVATGYIALDEYKITKFDSACSIIAWDTSFSMQLTSVTQSRDSSHFIYLTSIGKAAGDTFDALWITKFDKDGNILAGSKFNENGILSNGEVFVNKSNDIFIAAHLDSVTENYDGGWHKTTGRGWIAKLDHNFSLISKKTYKGIMGGTPSSINEDTNGDIVITGWAGEEMWAIKLNTDLDSLWAFQFHGDDNNPNMYFFSGISDIFPNNDILIASAGRLGAGGNFCPTYLVRLDQSGKLKWVKTLSPNKEWAYAIKCINDSDFVLGGWRSSSGSWLTKLRDFNYSNNTNSRYLKNNSKKPFKEIKTYSYFNLKGQKIPDVKLEKTGKYRDIHRRYIVNH